VNSEQQDKFDQYINRRSWFLREWQTLIIPLEHERRFWDQQAVDIAKSTANLLGVLNGGALVAIPTFTALGGVNDLGSILYPVLAFVFGLVTTVLAKIAGFFACTNRADLNTIQRDALSDSIVQTLKLSLSSDPSTVREPIPAKNDRNSAHWFRVFRFTSIGCTFVSIVSFIAGIVLGLGSIS